MSSLLLAKYFMDTFSGASQRKVGVAKMGDTCPKMPSFSWILSDDLVKFAHPGWKSSTF